MIFIWLSLCWYLYIIYVKIFTKLLSLIILEMFCSRGYKYLMCTRLIIWQGFVDNLCLWLIFVDAAFVSLPICFESLSLLTTTFCHELCLTLSMSCRLSKQQTQSSALEINWLLVKSDLLHQGRSVVSDYVVTTDQDLKSLSLYLLWILVWAVYNLTFCKLLRPRKGGFSKQFKNLLNWPSVKDRFQYYCEIMH